MPIKRLRIDRNRTHSGSSIGLQHFMRLGAAVDAITGPAGVLNQDLVRASRASRSSGRPGYSRAFLHTVPDVDHEIREALQAARRAVDLDGRDAMGHWSLGRALFLSRQHDDALLAIDHSLAVNPNYAQGHYARGFVGIMVDSGNPGTECALSYLCGCGCLPGTGGTTRGCKKQCSLGARAASGLHRGNVPAQFSAQE